MVELKRRSWHESGSKLAKSGRAVAKWWLIRPQEDISVTNKVDNWPPKPTVHHDKFIICRFEGKVKRRRELPRCLMPSWIRSRPSKPNQRKSQNEKFMDFAHFCEFWCFSLGKQARFTLNFCSGMPLRKAHELAFLWFGLPGPLLNEGSAWPDI